MIVLRDIFITVLITLCGTLCTSAQDRGAWAEHVNRLEAFGARIPQEKVYIHMDNTCYFLGETIWFKAYLQQTNNDKPSSVSGTLYVELLNHEGYLVERKLIEMKNGQGDGYFVLPDDSTSYAGYYELRAYTRWQLNWGAFEHPHYKGCDTWFGNKQMKDEFFRDYEKLYSRVFPVYNKPIEKGEYFLDMTMRPLQRNYKDDLPKMRVQFYPEGGNLVAGVPNNVAFEVTQTDGKEVSGKLSGMGQDVATVHRGRGSFTVTPSIGAKQTLTFTSDDGEVVKATLPEPEPKGVTLSVKREGEQWTIQTKAAGIATNNLALTVMHEGRLQHFQALDGTPINISHADLPCGVNQVTVFDMEGHLWADRLFFVNRPETTQPNLTISTAKDNYNAHERIDLDVRAAQAGASTVSIAVRDVSRGSRGYDTGNILTEMLLASEIRGFVPDPGYFFQADDDEHRQALDLLMLTQGWRRFDWHEMAIKGAWEITQKPERTPVVFGSVHNYNKFLKYDPRELEADSSSIVKKAIRGTNPLIHWTQAGDIFNEEAMRKVWGYDDAINPYGETAHTLELKYGLQFGHLRNLPSNPDRLKNEVLVHAEFTQRGSENAVTGDITTQGGQFQITQPHFYNDCVLFLSASDTTKWSKKMKSKEHQWILPKEDEWPEFSVRLSFPYPRFVKPYAYYHTQSQALNASKAEIEAEDGATLLRTVQVNGKRRGLRSYRYAVPATHLDAYEAYNAVVDAGLMDAYYTLPINYATSVIRLLVGDMGNDATYQASVAYGSTGTDIFAQSDESMSTIDGMSPEMAQALYSYMNNLEGVSIYTDYAPRLEGDDRYQARNSQTVVCRLERYEDESKRATYRDRCVRLPGFAKPTEFYSPDYSQRPLPEQKDYRRTLYWNPNLQLDSEGKAHVTLYNNSRTSIIEVDAQGQTGEGVLLHSK